MDESLQHLSHRSLMDCAEPPQATDSRIDAIVVPSARPATGLGWAAALAHELAVPLVVLCSRMSQRDEVLQFVRGAQPDITVYAIDMPPTISPPALSFRSDAMSAGRVFQRHSDTSLKRNLALLLARSANWQRIMFLDDDIVIPDAADVRRAAGLLDEFAAVGLRIGGFPDNSVVCHAIRETGGKQDTFVGAGALAVKIDAQMSFFPNIYNEDWFFLLDKKNLRPLSTTKHVAAIQQPYDPFASPLRATEEEFGDVLAEGAMAILDVDGKIGDDDLDYWKRFLASRAELIGDVMDRRKREVPDGAHDRMLESLTAAQHALREITPELCFEYMRMREDDLLRWSQALEAMSTDRSVPDSLTWLGLAGQWGSSTDEIDVADEVIADAEGIVRRYAKSPAIQRRIRALWIAACLIMRLI